MFAPCGDTVGIARRRLDQRGGHRDRWSRSLRRDAARPLLPRRAPLAEAANARRTHRRCVDTRLRFVRRLIYAAILLIGLAIAASRSSPASRTLARALLASGAIAAAIIGFAARQMLANFVAGIMLAITQPMRVGDWVTFEGNYGVVEDVRLNYTVLRTRNSQRIVIPNESWPAGS